MEVNLKEHNFNKDISYIAPNWEEMGKLIFELGKEILGSGKKYDLIVSIAKGGWTWTRTLADILGLEDICSVKTKLYQGIGIRSEELIFEQELPIAISIEGKDILLHDDVADSGKTLLAVKKYLEKKGAKSVVTASLFYKPRSIITPDFYAYQTTSWIVFPHELREFVNETYIKWDKEQLNKEEILARYKKLDLPLNQVEFFIETNQKNK